MTLGWEWEAGPLQETTESCRFRPQLHANTTSARVGTAPVLFASEEPLFQQQPQENKEKETRAKPSIEDRTLVEKR